ncbi:hypothetical protein GCE9029_01497 [Grimontia celer]|uniref:Uncharacterized protein n=1 Tax=Grimontia celer TaxID=1796497 RepID=A0A128EY55_9GAMM|nr:hypothetical protein GCE9029_01497 [Grimontia celer]
MNRFSFPLSAAKPYRDHKLATTFLASPFGQKYVKPFATPLNNIQLALPFIQ